MLLTPERLVWVAVPFSQEKGEFVRVAEEFTPDMHPRERKLHIEANLKYLKDKYQNGTPRPMSEAIWRRLENTDSWTTRTPDDVEIAIRRNTTSSGKRDVSAIIDEYNTGKIRAPIIMAYSHNRYTLVAGNTRLMVARTSNIVPKVVFIDTDW